MEKYNALTPEGNDIDAILEEVKRSRQGESGAPSKTWSIDDIDRLIAETNGEEYVPPVKTEKLTPAEDFSNILSREFDTAMFTVKPFVAPEPEMQDISSTTGNEEVDGQETFFEEINEYEEGVFELETVIVPEDEQPESPAEKYIKEPETETEKKASEIRPFYEGEVSPAEFFKHRAEPVTEEEDDGDMKEYSSSRIAEHEYRTRYFSSLKFDKPVNAEPSERPGIVVEKPRYMADNGLEAMPRIMTADEAKAIDMQKTRVIEKIRATKEPEASPVSEDVDGQIMLTGFDDIPLETIPEKQSEDDVEQQLWSKRKQKAKDFKLLDSFDLDEDFHGEFEASPEEIAREERARKRAEKKQELYRSRERAGENVLTEEYTAVEERTAVHTKLNDINRKATLNVAVTGVIQLLAVLFAALPWVVKSLSLESGFFGEGSSGSAILCALLLVAATALNYEKFIAGIKSLVLGKITADTTVALTGIVAFVQTLCVAIFAQDAIGSAAFASAGIFGVFITKVAEKLDIVRILGNFEICAYKYEHNMYAVHSLENEAEIAEFSKGLMHGDSDLLYSSQVSFPTDFLRNSRIRADDCKTSTVLITVSGVLSLVVAIMTGIINESFIAAISAFAGVFCMTAPILEGFVPAFILQNGNSKLNLGGSAIVGLEAAEKASDADAVVMDAADIFDRKLCSMHGMKDFKNIRIDDVLLYAAALVIKSGGPLRDCFEQVVDGRQELLPAIKELVYEDKLGISARINNQKVLLGSRSLLVNHNIEVPEKALEDRYSHSGRKVIYLAVAGKIAALFVVSYAVDKNLSNYFKALEMSGIQVLVRTNDVNVTEELIAKSFGLPEQMFKVLSSTGGRLFKRRRDAVCDRLPAGVIHDGTAFTMLKTVAVACGMSVQKKFGNFAQSLMLATGFVVALVLYCTGNGAFVNGATAVLYMLLSAAVAAGITLLNKVR